MPELLVDFITSLDGYASAEGWPGFWGLQGPEYLAWLDEQPDVVMFPGPAPREQNASTTATRMSPSR